MTLVSFHEADSIGDRFLVMLRQNGIEPSMSSAIAGLGAAADVVWTPDLLSDSLVWLAADGDGSEASTGRCSSASGSVRSTAAPTP